MLYTNSPSHASRGCFRRSTDKMNGSCITLSSREAKCIWGRLFVLALFWTACAPDHAAAQLPLPPLTFSCSPNPTYIGNSAVCTVHVGGGATGSVTLTYGQPITPPLPLDSNGDVTGDTGNFITAPGTFLVTAVYSGDGNYSSASALSAITAYSGRVMVTTDTLSCYPYILYSGSTATCKLHIPGGATGSVTFLVDGQPFNPATAGSNGGNVAAVNSNGDAVVTGGLAGFAVGSHVVQAIYSGDQNFGSFTTTRAVSVSSSKVQPSSVSVGCTPSPVTQGATGSCLVRVSGGATGQVTLTIDNQSVGSPVTLGTSAGNYGTATIPGLFGSLSIGSHAVTAHYLGDPNFAVASAATTVSIIGGETSPGMTVVCTPSMIGSGQATSCAAQLPAGATGFVLFSVDGGSETSAALTAKGSAVLTPALNNLSKGTHTVTASYAGDSNFSAQSAALTVTVAEGLAQPSISMTCAPMSFVAGQGITCPVSASGGETGSVQLYVDGNLVDGMGLDANGQAVFQNEFNGLSVGTHSVGFVYTGDLNFIARNFTGPIVTVVSQPTAPTFTATLTPASIQTGGQVSLAAQAQAGVTGIVSITINGQPFTDLQLNSAGVVKAGAAPELPSGTYPVVFRYLGDANFAPTSTTASLTISSPTTPPTISNVSPSTAPPGSGPLTINGSGFGAPGTLLFNSVAIPVLSWTGTAITFDVPLNATTGPLIVSSGAVQSNSAILTVQANSPACIVTQ